MSEEGLRHDERLVLGLALVLTLATAAFSLSLGWFGGFPEAQAASGHLPDWFWETMTVLGDERVLLALMLPFCLRHPRIFWSIVLAAIIGGLVSRGLKVWLDMPRPAAVFAAEQIRIIGNRVTSKSFPSGHTISVVAFAAVWLGMLGWRKTWPLLILAGLAGFSRVAVGAHWPFDVLVAAVIGSLAAWAGIHLGRCWPWGVRTVPHRVLVCVVAIGVATLPFNGQGYPDTVVFRVAVCLWGLAGFAIHYLLPLLRGGWRRAGRL